MKGFTLVSVLVATILLLGTILPLLSIQGRLHRQAIAASHTTMLQELTSDYQGLTRQTHPRSNTWQTDRYLVERKVRKLGAGLFEVRYRIALRHHPRRGWTLYRVWANS